MFLTKVCNNVHNDQIERSDRFKLDESDREASELIKTGTTPERKIFFDSQETSQEVK